MRIVLVTGGAKAGKSRWAERGANRLAGDVTFIATAEARDAEMAARIEAHREARPAGWTTIEAPIDVPRVLRESTTKVVILDCLTLWASNLLLGDGGSPSMVAERVDELLAIAEDKVGDLLVVTNEVGMGIVPDNELARAYRDVLGRTNARVAEAADQVVLMVAGLPVPVR